ncbi:hypothetical protein COO60DRAFT_1632689 [Scenedesmus sp. NREL 46B-D3]|nr:hypothetical protein COO60DRAFT_1632689 [Scenedesmus sp. NREL 46B-D3]
MQTWLQQMPVMFAQAYAQASLLWQHAVACWPAWTASLQHNVEYVIQYAVGVLPAWLLTVQAALHAASEGIGAIVGQLVSGVTSTARDAGANTRRLRQASSCWLAQAQPVQALARLASNLASWDSSGAAASVARGLTGTMAALTADFVVSSAEASRNSPDFAWGDYEFDFADLAGQHSSNSSSNPSMDGRLQQVPRRPFDVMAENLAVDVGGAYDNHAYKGSQAQFAGTGAGLPVALDMKPRAASAPATDGCEATPPASPLLPAAGLMPGGGLPGAAPQLDAGVPEPARGMRASSMVEGPLRWAEG